MSEPGRGRALAQISSALDRTLTAGDELTFRYAASDIRRETVRVAMRDGTQLATDIYFPPQPIAPAIAVRTPYGRASAKFVKVLLAFARSGYVAISQDCRGTGDSEPDCWDYYVYESEDGVDFVEWVIKQPWFDGFLGACGGSYVGQTQWCMAMHPRMTTIVPEVSGLGVAAKSAHHYMFSNAYARSVGKGDGKVPIPHTELERLMLEETLAGGVYNEPMDPPLSESVLSSFPDVRGLPTGQAKRRLWAHYCALPSRGRADFIKRALGVNQVSILEIGSLSALFGQYIAHDAHSLPHAVPADQCKSLHAPPLIVTGWYDWGLNDALATWRLIKSEAHTSLSRRARLIITPSAHSMPGYHEGREHHPELQRAHRTENNIELLLRWYAAVREQTIDEWPTVIYYLMGANRWYTTTDWPPPEARSVALYLGPAGSLTSRPPTEPSAPDDYTYDPADPTPTVGGSILSYVYPPGSVDVAEVQRRADVLTYTTKALTHDVEVTGPLRVILYAASSAVDTDFCVRLSDVFPDGRALQLQSTLLRARFRHPSGDPEPPEPGRIYRLEIDLWATANLFKATHRLRLDICSADFPKFERNSNRGGKAGPPVLAVQTIYHDPMHPSHLQMSVMGREPIFD